MKNLLILFLLLSPLTAHAYVGPGMGVGTIGVILGILLSIILAFVAIIWYPIKRLFKRNSKKIRSNTAKSKHL
jgi:hypothetical protein